MSKLAVSYSRISSVKQEDGFSIDAQLALLEKYAQTNNFILAEKFTTTESAKSKGRKDFNKMVDFVKKKKIKHILVEKTDRLLRNMNDYILAEELIIKFGMHIHLVKEGVVLHQESNSNEKFIFGIKSLMAKQYIDNLREETKKGMRASLLKGNSVFNPPFGYYYDKETKQVLINEEDGVIIKKIFKQYLAGTSVAIIGRNVDMKRTKLYLLLRNPYYIGKMRAFGEIFEGKHSPLIDIDAFYETQKRLDSNQTNKHRKTRNFKFSGILRCSNCNRVLVGEVKKNRTGNIYIYYACSSRLEKKPCKTQGYLSEISILDNYDALFSQLKFSNKQKEIITKSVNEFIKGQHMETRENVEIIKDKIKKTEDMIRKTEDLLTQEVITPNKYIELNSRYQNEVKTLQIKYSSLHCCPIKTK